MAEALAKASGIAKVHYRSLASHPQHELARRQMLGGYGRLKACVWPSCLGRMPSAREAALLTAATSGSAARTIGTSLKTISHTSAFGSDSAGIETAAAVRRLARSPRGPRFQPGGSRWSTTTWQGRETTIIRRNGQ